MAFTPAKVQRLIQKFGAPATWRTIRPGIMTESGRPVTQETTDVGCYAVVLPHDKEQKRTRQNDGTEQRECREIAYVSVPAGVSPSAADVLIWQGRTLRFEWLDLLAPSGTLLLITAGVQE
jgi:hypothetical protein